MPNPTHPHTPSHVADAVQAMNRAFERIRLGRLERARECLRQRQSLPAECAQVLIELVTAELVAHRLTDGDTHATHDL